MLRRVQKLTELHREKFLVAVMLPAFILGTLPQTACICADGRRQENCNWQVCQAIRAGDESRVPCGCACCPTQENHSCCCKAKAADREPVQERGPGLTAHSAPCCRAVVEAPPPVKGSEAAASWDIGLICTFAFELTERTEQPRLARRALHLERPPPLDAVIVFAHLTI